MTTTSARAARLLAVSAGIVMLAYRAAWNVPRYPLLDAELLVWNVASMCIWATLTAVVPYFLACRIRSKVARLLLQGLGHLLLLILFSVLAFVFGG